MKKKRKRTKKKTEFEVFCIYESIVSRVILLEPYLTYQFEKSECINTLYIFLILFFYFSINYGFMHSSRFKPGMIYIRVYVYEAGISNIIDIKPP